MKAVSIKPEGLIKIVEFPLEECGDKLRELIGGPFDCISLPKLGLDLWVHDEGLLLGLELNIFAKALWEADTLQEGGHIVGPVVITGIADSEGYCTSVPQDFIDMVIVPASAFHGELHNHL
jgi:hypothetical protein